MRKKKPIYLKIQWEPKNHKDRYETEDALLSAGATLLWGGPGGDYARCETKAIASKAGAILGDRCSAEKYIRWDMLAGHHNRSTGEALLRRMVRKVSAQGGGR